jgi:putative glutamine amidotransferase
MINNKPVIGVLATSNYMVTNDSFADTYRYGNNYIKKILDNGGIPLLIPYVDDRVIFESLEMCDGLILPGGNRVLSSSLEVIDYFYKSNKPILGICLGMQTLAMYSVNKDREEAKRIIKVIDNGVDHWPFELYRDSDSQLAHKLKIDKNSKLYKILKEENLEVNSVHKCTITEVGRGFKVSAYSEDGLIEGIEYDGDDKFIVGVQFHPEVLPQFNNIFKVFLDECKKEQ